MAKTDPTRFLDDFEIRVLDSIREYPKTSLELREIFGIPPRSMAKTLGRLKKLGCIEKIGTVPSTGYVIWWARV